MFVPVAQRGYAGDPLDQAAEAAQIFHARTLGYFCDRKICSAQKGHSVMSSYSQQVFSGSAMHFPVECAGERSAVNAQFVTEEIDVEQRVLK